MAAELLGADPNSPAYQAGNMVGNVVGGMVAGAVTGPAGSCAALARWARVAAKGARVLEKVMAVRDGVMGAIDTATALITALRCGDPSIIGQMVVDKIQGDIIGKVASSVGKNFDFSPCGRNCFLAGTPVWVLKDGADVDTANAELAAACATADRLRAAGNDAAAQAVLDTAIREWATTKPIETVTTADFALSKLDDDPHGALSFEAVVQTFTNERDEVEWLTIRDEATGETETIGCTVHPFYVTDTGGELAPIADVDACHLDGQKHYRRTAANGTGSAAGSLLRSDHGWVFSSDLRAGYVLTTADGRRLVVLAVRTEQSRRRTYNFTVNATHTYFVGKLCGWAHNATSSADNVYDCLALADERVRLKIRFRGCGRRLEQVLRRASGSV